LGRGVRGGTVGWGRGDLRRHSGRNLRVAVFAALVRAGVGPALRAGGELPANGEELPAFTQPRQQPAEASLGAADGRALEADRGHNPAARLHLQAARLRLLDDAELLHASSDTASDGGLWPTRTPVRAARPPDRSARRLPLLHRRKGRTPRSARGDDVVQAAQPGLAWIPGQPPPTGARHLRDDLLLQTV